MLSRIYNLCSRIIISSFHISNAFEQEEQLFKYKLMYLGVTLTGLVVTSKNWNLFSVNVFMVITGGTQLYRKFTYACLPSYFNEF